MNFDRRRFGGFYRREAAQRFILSSTVVLFNTPSLTSCPPQTPGGRKGTGEFYAEECPRIWITSEQFFARPLEECERQFDANANEGAAVAVL